MPLAGWEWAAAVTSWLGYLGLLLAAGGTFFLAFVHDGKDEERRLITVLIVTAAVVAFVARVAAEPVRAIQISGQGEQAVVDPRAYAVTLRTSDGWSGLVRLVGLSLLMVGVARRNSRRALWLATVGGLIALASTTLAGHTVTAEPQWLVRLADLAHMLTAAIWFGGLVLLGLILRRRWGRTDPVDGAGLVARFSGWATVALALVMLAGVSMAWAEVRSLDELFDSTYGVVLLIKVALVVGVAAVGAYNNRRLVPAIRRAAGGEPDQEGGHEVWRRLSTTVRLETVGLVVVLAITGMLVHIAPPRPHETVMDHAAQSPDAGQVQSREQ